ncbi:acyl-CoA thioesterase [Paracoccus sp. M683]|uniref:acyl-CoA thioesterase n=1 Tax=Paracoccus sp. M683 TaxID=2594268 RepID=UPI00117DC1F0|nr:acyl-CoA thioesterase [Paracoccus sp. M683]TRW97813.1 acyl-CoA thioesterase [Paracoccus sp. M683]
MPRSEPRHRDAYPVFETIQTRWNDNDQYGHIYNATYYELFDSAMNIWMMARGMLDPAGPDPIAVVVENGCTFFRQVSFPDTIHIGMRLAHLGNSSLEIEMGMFRGEDQIESAQARFVLVSVDPQNRRPTPFPDHQRQALATLRPC